MVFTQNILVENPQISGTGKSTIVMLFHPECDHCQKQLELMLTIPAVSNTTNLILVADETLQKLKIFYNKFHLEKYPWINIGKDYKHFFGPFYRPKTVPVLIFYNNQKNLKSYKQGNISEKEINKALE